MPLTDCVTAITNNIFSIMDSHEKLEALTSELKNVVTEATKTADTIADRKQAIENITSDEAIKAKVDDAIKTSQEIKAAEFKANAPQMEGRFKSYDHFLESKAGDSEVKEAQELNDNLFMATHLVSKTHRIPMDQAAERMKSTEAYKKFAHMQKDLTTATGSNWIPTGFSSNLMDDVRAATVLAQNIPQFSLPQDPYSWPVLHTLGAAYKQTTEAAALTEADPTDQKVTFATETLYRYVQMSTQFEADAAFAVAPVIRSEMTTSLAESLETAILNGDRTDGTHFDSDVGTTAASPQKLVDGLRYRVHGTSMLGTTAAGVNGGGNAITTADVAAARKLMGKYGLNDCAMVVSLSAYFDLIANSDVTTVDQMGASATLLSGQLGSVYGLPILVSGQGKEDLNASGVYDGSTTTMTEAVLFNRRSYMLAERGGIRFDQQRVVAQLAEDVVMSGRWDLQTFAPSGAVNVAVIYNITD